MQLILIAVVLAVLAGTVAYVTRDRWLPRNQASSQSQTGHAAIDRLWQRADRMRRQINISDPRQLKLAMDNPPQDMEGRYALLCMVYRESCEFLKMAKEYGWTDAGVSYKLEALTVAAKQLSEFFVRDQAGMLKPNRSLASAEWFKAMSAETCTAFEASRFIFEKARAAKAARTA